MRPPAIAHPGPTSNVVLYWIGRLWMWVFGWDVEGEPPPHPKAVIIAAPHTSNWDLPHMLAAAWVFRMKISWMGKHTLFKPPFGWFLRALGGVPIDRSAPNGVVAEVARVFAEHDQLFLAIPPEGTRSRRLQWKSGFYWIADTAKVPIVAGCLDYGRRRAALAFNFLPSGDVVADMDRLRDHYAPIRGKFPELESVITLKEEATAAPAEAPPPPPPVPEHTH